MKEQLKKSWHTLAVNELFSALEAKETGFSNEEAQSRLKEFGHNRLPHKPPPAWWEFLLRQFHSPLIYILGIAAIVALGAGDFLDAGFIFAVLAINALIGGYQEWRAEQSSRALQSLLHIRAAVMRGGEIFEVDAEDVVPGDIVWLESGNRVPADMRLLSAHGLEIDESFLTGESLAVLKDPAWTGEADAPMGDRRNLAFAGAIVQRGRGKGIVVNTGANTVVGQLALDVLDTSGGRPPLLERIERFSKTVAIVVLVSVIIIALMGIVLHGYSIHDMFMFSIALAVSAIPEGLPAALTVALAIATTRMAARGVIVRRLAAVEGLGSCTLIASDKTGTLTCNELTVKEIRLADRTILHVSGEGFAPNGDVVRDGEALQKGQNSALDALARAAVLCNEGDLHQRDGSWVWRGDPTDLALLTMGHKCGWLREATLDEFKQINEIPFEPEHAFSATFHRFQDEGWVFVKGAPERVLSMCEWSEGSQAPSDFHKLAETMAERGFRVLALAEGKADPSMDESQPPPAPEKLKFLGFVGMIDPLRTGVKEAVKACHKAGVGVCMITGDHPVTALAISRDLGLANQPNQVISGRQLEGKSQEELKEILKQIRVFARVTPRQKLELVEAARAAGHFVAVTGDGVNDAPALRTANIGVAMGKSGTDVAREAAELVISDDNFATIVAGIEEGRVAYDNVRKVIFLLISTGAAEVILLGMALAVGQRVPLPLLPVQILWLNLVTNGIQGIALAFEPNEGDTLRRKPRPPQEPIFNRLMIERTIVSAMVIALVSLAAFWFLVPPHHSDSPQYEADVKAARNCLLLLLVLFENVHIGNCRSETRSAFKHSPFRSPFLLGGMIIAFLVHVASMYIPMFQKLLGTEPVSLETWITMVILALTVFVAMELHKLYWRKRHGAPENAQQE